LVEGKQVFHLSKLPKPPQACQRRRVLRQPRHDYTPRLLALLLSASALAESVKDREGAVRQDKTKLQDGDRWNYNDVQRGFDEAKKSRQARARRSCAACPALRAWGWTPVC